MTTAFNATEFDLTYRDDVELTYWSMARNAIVYQSLKKAGLVELPIIEVGCGRGIVLKSLLQKNVNCFGIEFAEVEPVTGTENKIITGKNALDFDMEFRQRFRTLMLLDVIEHIEDDYEFIGKLLQAYSNVQYLIIAVPTRSELWSNYDIYFHHFRRYDLKMIREIMQNLGFEILHCRYFFNLIYLLILIQNKMGLKRKLSNYPPKGKISKFLNKIIAYYFIMEKAIVPGKIVGSSIICIARKKN